MHVVRPGYRRPRSAARPRTLGDACRKADLDDDGLRCPDCPLRTLCESEARWLVPQTPRPRYLV